MRLQEAVAGLPPTQFYYWDHSYDQTHSTTILKAIPEEKKDVYLVLDSTIFHPKSGGQPSDQGTIRGDSFDIQIKKSILVGRHVVLWGRINEGTPTAGAALEEIDWPWRYLLMRRHTAAHLFDHCLSHTIGFEVETTDSWLGDPCYAGYKGQAPTPGVFASAAQLEKELIRKGFPVKTETVPRATLLELAAKAPNLRRLPELEEYRLVTIEGASPIPCGGTHVKDASEIKEFQIEKIAQLAESFRVYFGVS